MVHYIRTLNLKTGLRHVTDQCNIVIPAAARAPATAGHCTPSIGVATATIETDREVDCGILIGVGIGYRHGILDKPSGKRGYYKLAEIGIPQGNERGDHVKPAGQGR